MYPKGCLVFSSALVSNNFTYTLPRIYDFTKERFYMKLNWVKIEQIDKEEVQKADENAMEEEGERKNDDNDGWVPYTMLLCNAAEEQTVNGLTLPVLGVFRAQQDDGSSSVGSCGCRAAVLSSEPRNGTVPVKNLRLNQLSFELRLLSPPAATTTVKKEQTEKRKRITFQLSLYANNAEANCVGE